MQRTYSDVMAAILSVQKALVPNRMATGPYRSRILDRTTNHYRVLDGGAHGFRRSHLVTGSVAEWGSCTVERGSAAYRSAISAEYFCAIRLRLSFMVSVISSPPGSQKTGNTLNRLTCSTPDSFMLPRATPVAICAIT